MAALRRFEVLFALVATLMVSGAAMASGTCDDSKIILLEKKVDVDREYCRLEKPNPHFPCEAPYKRLALIYVPTCLATPIIRHVDSAYARGYYRDLSYEDLHHGHLILKGPQTEYPTPSDFFSDTSAVLYHSAEHNTRWTDEGKLGVPIEHRTPRSYVGFPDGHIERAIDIVRIPAYERVYNLAGTIYSDEIVKARPDLSSHVVGNLGGYPRLWTTVCHDGGCQKCEARTSVTILPERGGRFQTPDGEDYELTIRCVFK